MWFPLLILFGIIQISSFLCSPLPVFSFFFTTGLLRNCCNFAFCCNVFCRLKKRHRTLKHFFFKYIPFSKHGSYHILYITLSYFGPLFPSWLLLFTRISCKVYYQIMKNTNLKIIFSLFASLHILNIVLKESLEEQLF